MAIERQIDQIFISALELDPSERSAFLERACANSLERREIRSLIDAYVRAGNFLEDPILDSLAPADPLIGRTLGDFIIREKIGEGGFGVGYRADQLTLQRESVVKVLHTKHSADRNLIERFLREARLASRLE